MRVTWLADMAAFERDRRGATYPGSVAAGKRSAADAEADYAAWVAIAEWFAGRRPDEISFAAMEHATSRALASLEALAERRPGERAILERRDAVAAIHERVAHRRALIDDINTRLRAWAQPERQAA